MQCFSASKQLTLLSSCKSFVDPMKILRRDNARQYGFKGGEHISLIQKDGKKDFGTVGVDGQISVAIPSHEAYIIELLKK